MDPARGSDPRVGLGGSPHPGRLDQWGVDLRHRPDAVRRRIVGPPARLVVLASLSWLRPRALGQGAILGAIALVMPNTLFTLGLEDLPVNIGGLLIALVPIATVAAAHFLVAGERFDSRSIPGLITSLVGTGILVGLGGQGLEGVGNLWRGMGCP